MIRFDWYQATVQVPDPSFGGLIDHLMAAWELVDFVPTRAMHGYLHGGKIIRGSTDLCTLWWGGNPGVNVHSTSDQSPVLAAALKSFGAPFGVSRVDACLDWFQEGCFESLSGHLIQFAQDNRITINQQGDWVRGQARTLYLGSPTSTTVICLYEKGYEQRAKHGGEAPLNWVRLEVRVRPKGVHKMAVSSWEPRDVFGAGWVADALAILDLDIGEKRSVGTLWKPADVDRARAAMIVQYGATMSLWAEEIGSWDELGSVLKNAVSDRKKQSVGNTAKSSPPLELPAVAGSLGNTAKSSPPLELPAVAGSLGNTAKSSPPLAPLTEA